MKGVLNMASPASIAKHPIHPMLIVFPVGLWIFSCICDLIYAMGWGGAVWKDVAFYTMAGGVVGALLAAIPGLIDLISISDQKTKKLGITHMILNLIVVGLFAYNLWVRYSDPISSTLPYALSIIGLVLLAISGWLGGEMVYVRGVGVDMDRDVRTVEEDYDKRVEDRNKRRVA
jgi:uncharacterized membrane protein